MKRRSQRHPKLSSLYEFTEMRNSHEELHKIAAGLHSFRACLQKKGSLQNQATLVVGKVNGD